MKYLSVRSFVIFFLVVGATLSSILKIGISKVDARVPEKESLSDSRFPQGVPVTAYVIGSPLALQQTPVTFPTFTPTSTLFVEPTITATPFGVSQPGSDQGLRAFIHAPPGVQPQPFVILAAFESASSASVEIRGFENLREFICTGSPCALPLTEDSTVRFRAYSSSNGESPEVTARVRVETKGTGYLVTVESVNQYSLFRDSCLNYWNIKDEAGESWSRFPTSPFQLNTDKTQHLLIARLIANKIVDAEDCPNGGLGPGLDYPTGCGVERAKTKMIEWQNQYDFTIWTTSLQVGIPPKILKSLIEYESQYWPANKRFYLDEIGLGQVNQLGIDVLLRRNADLYNKVCPTVYSDCSKPYAGLEPEVQAVIRGAVINSIDANCTSCSYGLDLTKANQSIPLIAQLLQANCQTVDLLDFAGKPEVQYDDLWKFTMASYHSGFSCVRDAVLLTRDKDEPENWESVAPNITCKGAESYVNGLWDNLLSFDAYLIDTDSVKLVQVAPTFVPTRTPIPPPTEIPSGAKVWVRAYLDANGNGSPDDTELLDGIFVELLLRNGVKFSGTTLNGQVIFDMAAYPAGTSAIVSLPGLYREKLITLPKEGAVQIDFVFTAPNIPNELP